jgi:hypothetical protein
MVYKIKSQGKLVRRFESYKVIPIKIIGMQRTHKVIKLNVFLLCHSGGGRNPGNHMRRKIFVHACLPHLSTTGRGRERAERDG